MKKSIFIVICTLIFTTITQNTHAAIECKTAASIGKSCGNHTGCASGFYLCGYNSLGNIGCVCQQCASGYYCTNDIVWPESGGMCDSGGECAKCTGSPVQIQTTTTTNNGVITTTEIMTNQCVNSFTQTTTTYSCDIGYYGSPTNGSSGCTRCPSSGGVYGTTASYGKKNITDCYIPAGTYTDSAGTYTYSDACYYTE